MESSVVVVGRIVSIEENKHVAREYSSGGRYDAEDREYRQTWFNEAKLVVDEVLKGSVHWIPTDSTRTLRLVFFDGLFQESDGQTKVSSSSQNYNVGDEGVWCLTYDRTGFYRSVRFARVPPDEIEPVRRIIKALETNYAGWAPGIPRDGMSWDMMLSSDFGTHVSTSVLDGNVWLHGSYSRELRINGEPKFVSPEGDQFIARADVSGRIHWIKALGFQSGSWGEIVADRGGVLLSEGIGGLRNAEPVSLFGRPMPFSGPTMHLLVSISSEGDIRWAQSFGGRFSVLTPHPSKDGHYWVVGAFRGDVSCADKQMQSNGGSDWFVGKLTSQGNPEFLRTFGGAGEESLVSSALDRSGQLVVATSTRAEQETMVPRGQVPRDVIIARIGLDGFPMWSDTLGGPPDEIPIDIAIGPSGRIAVAIGIDKPSRNGSRSRENRLMMLNVDGALLWDVPGGGHDIEIDEQGRIFCLGTYDERLLDDELPPSAGDSDIFAMCFDRDGKRLWSLRDGGVSADYARSLHLLPNDRALITLGFNATSFLTGRALMSGGWEDAYIVNVPMSSRRRP